MDERVSVISDLLNQILSEIQDYQGILTLFKQIISSLDEGMLQRLVTSALSSNEPMIMNLLSNQGLVSQVLDASKKNSRPTTHKRGRGK